MPGKHLRSLRHRQIRACTLMSALLLLLSAQTDAQQTGSSSLPSINPRYGYSAESIANCASLREKLATLSQQIEQDTRKLDGDIAAFNARSEAIAEQQPVLQARNRELAQLRQQVQAKTEELDALRQLIEERYHLLADENKILTDENKIDRQDDPQMRAYNDAVDMHRQSIKALQAQFAAQQKSSEQFNRATAALKKLAAALQTRRSQLNDDVLAYNKAVSRYNAQCQQ